MYGSVRPRRRARVRLTRRGRMVVAILALLLAAALAALVEAAVSRERGSAVGAGSSAEAPGVVAPPAAAPGLGSGAARSVRPFIVDGAGPV